MRILLGEMCSVGLVVAILLSSGCGKHRENITLAGSTAFQPFAEKLAEHYMATHPDVSITIQGGGSALGIQSALSGAAQVGMADLVKLPQEAATLKSIVVARDGIAVVLNPANEIKALTLEQVRGIFSGTVNTVAGLASGVGEMATGAASGAVSAAQTAAPYAKYAWIPLVL